MMELMTTFGKADDCKETSSHEEQDDVFGVESHFVDLGTLNERQKRKSRKE